jgi:hypothetical protein
MRDMVGPWEEDCKHGRYAPRPYHTTRIAGSEEAGRNVADHDVPAPLTAREIAAPPTHRFIGCSGVYICVTW